MISRVSPSKFQHICITSVSGRCVRLTFKVCQIVEGVSIIRRFHEFFNLIFGGFLTVQRRARSMKIGKPERVPRAERERTDRLLLG